MIKYRVIVQAAHYTPKPRRTRVTVHHVKEVIRHAQNLCFNYEDTIECKLAWETATELSEELARQHEEDLIVCRAQPDPQLDVPSY